MDTSQGKKKLRERLEGYFSLDIARQRMSHVRSSKSSIVSRLSRAIGERFASTAARSYGYALLTFDALTILLCYAGTRFQSFGEADRASVILGLVFSILSVPFLVFDTPIYRLMQENSFTNFLFFDFFCLPTRQKPQQITGIHPLILIFAAVALAVLGFFISPLYVALGIGAVLLLAGSVAAPEFPFFLTLLLFPYIPLLPHASVALGGLILLSTLSYVRKAIDGNRFVSITLYGIPLALFGVLYVISGAVHGNALSTESGLILAVFLLGFPLANNLITNRRLADAALGSVVVSSMPVAVWAIVQAIVGVENGNWIDPAFEGKLTDRVYATFGNPNIYAVFLLVALMFSLALAVEKKQRAKKSLYAAAALLNLAALVLTWSRGAWVALLFGLFICLILQIKRHGGVIVSLLVVLPYALYLLPEALVSRFMSIFNLSDSTVLYRFSIWRSSAAMLKDHPWLGIGVGADNFSSVFSSYAEAGVTAPHSHSLFLQIACEAGVIALAIFLLLLVLRAVHLSVFARHIKASSVFYPALFSTAALFCLLVFGVADYPFTNPTMLYLFFTVFGLGSATLRIAKQEQRDRALFYSAEMGSQTAELDIELDRF